jgi:hypothetical protein
MPKGVRKIQTSGPAPTKTRVQPLTQTTKAALIERFKDFPGIDVIERRFENPNDPGSLPILLKGEDAGVCINSDHQNKLRENSTDCHICHKPVREWYVRWVNTGIEGRWGQIRSKGYVPVEVSELKDAQDVSDLVKMKEDEGKIYVRRGDRGAEILCKMPLALYIYLKRAQRETQKVRNNSKKAMADDLAEIAGGELGDEAGQMIHDGGISVESMKRTRRSLEDEMNDDLIEA